MGLFATASAPTGPRGQWARRRARGVPFASAEEGGVPQFSSELKAFNDSACCRPSGGMSLSRPTGTSIHRFVFIQELKGSKMSKAGMTISSYTIFASRRKKKVCHLTAKPATAHSLLVCVLGKGKWEISRNLPRPDLPDFSILFQTFLRGNSVKNHEENASTLGQSFESTDAGGGQYFFHSADRKISTDDKAVWTCRVHFRPKHRAAA